MDSPILPETSTLFKDNPSSTLEYVMGMAQINIYDLSAKFGFGGTFEDLLDSIWLTFSDKDRLDHKDPITDLNYNDAWAKANEIRNTDVYKDVEEGFLRRRILEKMRLKSNLTGDKKIYTRASFTDREHWYKKGRDRLSDNKD